jgi:hypothetical protein
MQTWIFETNTKERGSILVCVRGLFVEAAWDTATAVLKAANQSPTKSNGYFGFITIGCFDCDDVPDGIITREQFEDLCAKQKK